MALSIEFFSCAVLSIDCLFLIDDVSRFSFDFDEVLPDADLIAYPSDSKQASSPQGSSTIAVFPDTDKDSISTISFALTDHS